LQIAVAGSAAALSGCLSPGTPQAGRTGNLAFGLIADVHHDVMHDAISRIDAFTSAMTAAQVDFTCHLGDFCQARECNRAFLDRWNSFGGPRYHVLGNHDMDGGFTAEQTAAFYGMPAPYYSFDVKGIHFMVLNGNEPGGKSKGYKRFVSPKQIDWMEKDLSATESPVIVLIHQALGTAEGIENASDVRKVLERPKTSSGRNKVVVCFCGHHHDDSLDQVNGINYIRINSASYYWLSSKFKHKSYGDEIHSKYPYIECTAPYRDPLWATVEIGVSHDRILVRGKKTQWVGPDPWAVGADKKTIDPAVVVPWISDRDIRI
jgi:predicted phosphodiesterase